jgi:DNA-directed RNA polymerase subunit alpha
MAWPPAAGPCAQDHSSLKRGGVITIGELVTRSEGDLLNIRNFGSRHLDEVREKLHELGLSLREE